MSASLTDTGLCGLVGGVYDLTSAANASTARSQLLNALDTVTRTRAKTGSNLTRLQYTQEQLGTLRDNLTAAHSRITDVDVAEESTRYARYNILVQAGTAMLAQANAMPQAVLKLLA